MANNTESVGEDSKLIDIAEMVVDVELFCIRAGSGLRGHKAVSHLVRVVRLVFVVSFEAADEGVKDFRVIFRDIKLNTGGIESKYLCKGGIDSLADGFGKIYYMLEHQISMKQEGSV